MSQLPQLLSPQQRINNGPDKIAIAIIRSLVGFTQTIEDIDLDLERVQAFFMSCGVEKKGRNRLKELIIVFDMRILEESVNANVDNVEVYQLQEYLFAVVDVLKNLQNHPHAGIVSHLYHLCYQVDYLFIKPPVSEKHLAPIEVLADVQKEFQDVQHKFLVEEQGLDVSIHNPENIVNDEPHNGLSSNLLVFALYYPPRKPLQYLDFLLHSNLLEVLNEQYVIGGHKLIESHKGCDIFLTDVWCEAGGMGNLVNRWLIEDRKFLRLIQEFVQLLFDYLLELLGPLLDLLVFSVLN